MKKKLAVVVVLSFLLNACLPAFSQPTAAYPTPISEVDLQLTAAVLSQQTLQAIPSNTSMPSETPVIVTATRTEIAETATETQNPALLTLTATLGTGTVTAENVTGTPGAELIVGTLPFTGTPSLTPNPFSTATSTIDPKPQFYGTLPPNLPFGHIFLINKAKADAYISLRVVTKDGYVTILEYPVKGTVNAKAPAGKYTYVAWVGGRQFTGSFSLSEDNDLTITLFKDKITIK
ncbi:MAG: hypothetical protein JNM46_02475 [Anaerolineales bacterium]|nr:hypothetical protein [Anaerolineales bacterium]